MLLKDAIKLANEKHCKQHPEELYKFKKQCKVMPEDVSIMLQYSLLGLNYHEIKEKMNKKFSVTSIRHHLKPFRSTNNRVDTNKAFNYLKQFNTSYTAGIEA